MSDCEQIRLYIQQQFDADLPAEDERAVATHLESCDPCTRYRNQIEQVVVFAQDLSIAEEFLPAQYEKLVGKVVEHLPKPSLSGFDKVVNFVGKVLGLRPKGTNIVKPLDQASRISFPHIDDSAISQLRTHRPAAETIRTEPLPVAAPSSESVASKPTSELPPSPPPSPQPAIEATVTSMPDVSVPHSVQKISTVPLIPEAPSAAAPTSTEIVPPTTILSRLANVLEGNEPTPRRTARPASTPPLTPTAAPTVTPVASSAPPATPPPVAAPPVAPPPVTPPPVAPLPVAPPPPPPPPPPAIQSSPAQIESDDQNSSKLLKGVGDADIDNIFTQTLGVSPEAASATVRKPSSAAKSPTKSEESRSSGVLKGIGDADIDNIFTQTLGVSPEAASATVRKPSPKAMDIAPTEVTPPPVAPTPAPPPAAQAAPPATPKAETVTPKSKSLFLLDDDTMDKIFAENLGIQEKTDEGPAEKITLEEAITMAPPPAPIAETVALTQPTPSLATEIPIAADENSLAQASIPIAKEPLPPPKQALEVEGLGRLDQHSQAALEGPSQIGAIGKFLLDKQDIQNLEKIAQSNLEGSNLRILTPDASQDLQNLLQQISKVDGVVGSVIVGHDGIVVGTDLPKEFDSDSIAVWSLGVYLNTDNAIKKMGRNSVNKLVAQTSKGHLAITDFGAGILATLTHDASRKTLVGVMNVISELVSSN